MFGPQRRIRICGRPERGALWQDRGGGDYVPAALQLVLTRRCLSLVTMAQSGRDELRWPLLEVRDLREAKLGTGRSN